MITLTKNKNNTVSRLNQAYIELENFAAAHELTVLLYSANFKKILETAIAVFPILISDHLEKILAIPFNETNEKKYQFLLSELANDASLVVWSPESHGQLIHYVGEIFLGKSFNKFHQKKSIFKELTADITQFMADISSSLPALVSIEILREKITWNEGKNSIYQIPSHHVLILVDPQQKAYIYQALLGEFDIRTWVMSSKFKETHCGCDLATYAHYLSLLTTQDESVRTDAYNFLFNIEKNDFDKINIKTRLQVKYNVIKIDIEKALKNVLHKRDEIAAAATLLAGRDLKSYILETCWENLLNQKKYSQYKDKIQKLKASLSAIS